MISVLNHNYSYVVEHAGRGGTPSRAHVFYSSRRKKMDQVVNEYCTLKENCRRYFMLRAIGSMEETPPSSTCCDVCSTRISIPIPLNFELLANDPPPRKRPRRATRKVDKAAEERLFEGRERSIHEGASQLPNVGGKLRL